MPKLANINRPIKFPRYRGIACSTLLIILSTILLVSGCHSKPTHFYVLSAAPLSIKKNSAPQATTLSIGLGPITIPDYLQRPQIVTRFSNNQLSIDEFHRWAEPLSDNINRVIEQQWLMIYPNWHISHYPWTYKQPIDYRIIINILRFDTTPTGYSDLIAKWRITDKTQEITYYTHTSHLHYMAKPNNYTSIVNAMDINLTRLSQHILKQLNILINTNQQSN